MIEIPSDAVAPERAGPWNMVACDDCQQIVAFDQEDLRQTADAVASE